MLAVKDVDRSEYSGKKMTIDEIVFEAGDLAALPQVILKLIDLTADPKVSAKDVEKVIQTDQGTTARVLTLANSSYYGLPRRISSVKDAVVFLGFKSVRGLAMQVTAFNMFLGKSDNASLARRDLWRHSLYTGLCTRVICKWLRPEDARIVDSEEAFTSALLHDMGKMALESALPEQHTQALAAAAAEGLRFHQIEHEYLPYTHSIVGSVMAERWSLPESLCDTVLNHHHPLEAQVNPSLTAVITLADEISQGLHEPDPNPDADETREEPVNDAATILKFSPEVIRGLNDACKLEMDKGIALSSS